MPCTQPPENTPELIRSRAFCLLIDQMMAKSRN
jgi:hypothetical protein